jgi:HAD superfamily hydrolase (TIGR01484 family)
MKLVVVDIDGCLLPKGGQTIDLSVVDRIREHNQLSQKNSAVPPVTLCSGRPEPYVELLMKLIEGYIPALFEWGGGLYIPDKYNFLYNDVFTGKVRKSRQVIEDVIRSELVSKLGARIQPGKEVAVTVYPGQGMSSGLLHARLEEILEDIEAARYYTIYCTQTHIDMLPVGLDKGIGLEWLADFLQVEVQEIAGIGNDKSDLSFLRLVGFSACPNNSESEVKASVDYVSPYNNGKGVINVLERLVG